VVFLETTGSPGKMGIVLAAEAAPLALFSVASGRLAAHWGPRRTLLLCDLVWALTIGTIPALHAAEALSFALLVALSFVAGIPWAAHYGSQDSLVAELAGATEVAIARAKAVFQTAGVATELIPSALRPETLTVSTALVLGAGFAGLLLTAPTISNLGVTAVFGALAVLQSLAAGLIWWLDSQRPARSAT
jgi:MFS family permease